MHLRSGDDGESRAEKRGIPAFPSEAFRTRSERVRQLRQNIAADAYRSADVADVIARRILSSRDL